MIDFLQTLFNTLEGVAVSGYENVSRMKASMNAILQMVQKLQAEAIAEEEKGAVDDGRQGDIRPDGGLDNNE